MAAPILVPIIGVSQRCGTHWLFDLLASHPSCRPASGHQTARGADFEDLLLESANMLTDYASRTRRRWDPSFATQANEEALVAHLGGGLARFLTELDSSASVATHVVTKSPTAEGLDVLPRLWPDAKPLLLVRDGADVVASALASFGGRAERWIRVWRSGARQILDFSERHPDVGLLVRYESLDADLPTEVARITRHVGLDPDLLDLDAVRTLPKRGSADTAGDRGSIHWRPITNASSSVGRGAELAEETRARLGWLAGDELRALAYPVPDPGETAGHRARDAAWAVAKAGRRILQR